VFQLTFLCLFLFEIKKTENNQLLRSYSPENVMQSLSKQCEDIELL
jgi:hypothetical protein